MGFPCLIRNPDLVFHGLFINGSGILLMNTVKESDIAETNRLNYDKNRNYK